MKSKHLFFFLKSVCPHWQPYYNNSVQLFRSVSGWSIAPVSLSLSFFSFFFMPISASSFLIIMTWLVLEVLMVELRREVGVEERGSDEGGVDEVEERRGLVSLLLQDC